MKTSTIKFLLSALAVFSLGYLGSIAVKKWRETPMTGNSIVASSVTWNTALPTNVTTAGPTPESDAPIQGNVTSGDLTVPIVGTSGTYNNRPYKYIADGVEYDLWKLREELPKRVLTDGELNALLDYGWEDLYRFGAWFASGKPGPEYQRLFNNNLQTQATLRKLAAMKKAESAELSNFDPNAPATELTTEWVAGRMVKLASLNRAGIAAINDYELGLRSDGVVVWRRVK